MIIDDFPRDLLMTGAIFGIAAFVWAGWAQERPPKHWIWRAAGTTRCPPREWFPFSS